MEFLLFQELTEKLLDIESGRMALKNEVKFLLPPFLSFFCVSVKNAIIYEISNTDFQKFPFTLALPILLPEPNNLVLSEILRLWIHRHRHCYCHGGCCCY